MTTKEAISWFEKRMDNITMPGARSMYAMAIDALREQEKRRWIPVTERLPKRPPDRVDDQGRSWFTTGIECLVYDGKNVFAAHYCFMNKCFWYSDSLHPLKNITHWTPLPEPPKEEKDK